MLDPYPLGSFAADSAARSAAEAGNRAEQAEAHFRQLQSRIDQLSLLTEAMWSLIQEKTSLKEADLLERFCKLKLNRSDAATMTPCPACDRPMASKQNKCLYCEYVRPVQNAFQIL